MRKGVLDYCVLLLLRGGALYSADIIGRLRGARLIVVEGTLYPLLSRLKNEGLLSYDWRESLQGPPRKYYALTDKGRAALVEMDAAWTELAEAIGTLKAVPAGDGEVEGATNEKPTEEHE